MRFVKKANAMLKRDIALSLSLSLLKTSLAMFSEASARTLIVSLLSFVSLHTYSYIYISRTTCSTACVH